MAGKDGWWSEDEVIDRINGIVDAIDKCAAQTVDLEDKIKNGEDNSGILSDMLEIYEAKLRRLGRLHDNFYAEFFEPNERPKKCITGNESSE